MSKKKFILLCSKNKSPFITDYFNRANSTTTLGATDTGQLWTALAGTWGISINKAYLVSETSQAVAIIDTGFVNLIYTIDLTTSPTTNRIDCGVVFRVIDNSNYLLFSVTKSTTANTIKIWKNVAGSFTVLAEDTAAGLVENTLYATKVVLNGNSISVYLNDILRLSYVLTGDDITKFSTQTKLGIRVSYTLSSDDRGTRFDNLKVFHA